MKESFKTRLNRVEQETMPTKRKSIYEYSDEELEQIITDWEAENSETSPDESFIIIRNALNRCQ